MKRLLLILFSIITTYGIAQPLKHVHPESVGFDSKQLSRADSIIQQAVDNHEIPGAVLAIVYQDKMIHLKAIGNKQIYPSIVKMESNTIFDLASMTKPIATGISIMILVERGQLRLSDKVKVYLPSFQDDIRIEDLLTHTSGLPPYAPVEELKKRYGAPNPKELLEYIATCKRSFPPQTAMQYSCLNFITLQYIVEKISRMSLRDFAKENIYDVLDMKHTDFCPAKEMLSLIAPTEKQADGNVLLGVVHDPLARIMNGGVSGNAGLFSSADDLAILAAALLNHGSYNGKHVLSPQGVEIMTSVPQNLTQFGRTLGWDAHSNYASNQGDLLGKNTYGHTGYTGTSIVIDPDLQLAIILLTNRVHPYDKGSVIRLRALVSNAIAAALIHH